MRLLWPLLALFLVGAYVSYFVAAHFASLAYDRWLYDSARALAQQVRLVEGSARLELPKAAIEMLIRGVAKEEGRYGIRANCVGPGWVNAGLGKAVLDNEFPPEHVERIKKSIPLRKFGEPEDLAEAVVFLLSSRAKFITGQSLAVDGGGQL